MQSRVNYRQKVFRAFKAVLKARRVGVCPPLFYGKPLYPLLLPYPTQKNYLIVYSSERKMVWLGGANAVELLRGRAKLVHFNGFLRRNLGAADNFVQNSSWGVLCDKKYDQIFYGQGNLRPNFPNGVTGQNIFVLLSRQKIKNS